MRRDKRLHAAPEEGRRRAIGRYHDAYTPTDPRLQKFKKFLLFCI